MEWNSFKSLKFISYEAQMKLPPNHSILSESGFQWFGKKLYPIDRKVK